MGGPGTPLFKHERISRMIAPEDNSQGVSSIPKSIPRRARAVRGPFRLLPPVTHSLCPLVGLGVRLLVHVVTNNTFSKHFFQNSTFFSFTERSTAALHRA